MFMNFDSKSTKKIAEIFSNNIFQGSNNLRNGESPEKVVSLLEQIVNYVGNTHHRAHTRLILASLIPSPETEERTHDAFVQCNIGIHGLVKKNQSFTEFCNLSKVHLGLFLSIHFFGQLRSKYTRAKIIATDFNQNLIYSVPIYGGWSLSNDVLLFYCYINSSK